MARRKQAEPCPADVLRDILSLVGRTVPLEIVERWTPGERELARDWAAREHLRAGDNTNVRRKPEPSFVHDGCAERFKPAPGECPKGSSIWSNGGHRMQRRFHGELHIVDCADCGALSPDSD